jgi:putative DNA-invertase from lambdoid prophage Rac
MSTRAIYIRTPVAANDGEGQRHALLKAATARGWGRDYREFVDIGHSGTKSSRPALDELNKAIQRGEVREVMITELSRLFRSLPHLILGLRAWTTAGAAVISLRESIDLTTPTGALLVNLLGSIAEFELSLTRSRISSGFRKVMETGQTRSGKPVGRPRREVDVEEAQRLRSEGRSWRSIAQALRCPRRTVERAVAAAAQNPDRFAVHSPARKARLEALSKGAGGRRTT